MKLNIVCNRCNREYPITELSNLDYTRIINVKTGESLKEEIKTGIYRIMDIMELPCGSRDSHWVFITEENNKKEDLAKMLTIKERKIITDKIFAAGTYPDSIRYSTKENLFTAKWGYFYRHGRTAEGYAEKIKTALKGVHIASARDIWNPWPKDSYFEVKFRIKEDC